MKHVTAVLCLSVKLTLLITNILKRKYNLLLSSFKKGLQPLFWNTVRSGSHCALRLRYADFVVRIKVAVEVCCCFTVFSC
jgi:hypothetical protein